MERLKKLTALRGVSGFEEEVRAYVLERFLLDREEEEEGIIPLAQKSVEKLTGIPRETLAAADRPSGCTAATAVLDKKVLLILSLCKGLSVTIPVAEAPAIQTVRQLAEALYERVNL